MFVVVFFPIGAEGSCRRTVMYPEGNKVELWPLLPGQ